MGGGCLAAVAAAERKAKAAFERRGDAAGTDEALCLRILRSARAGAALQLWCQRVGEAEAAPPTRLLLPAGLACGGLNLAAGAVVCAHAPVDAIPWLGGGTAVLTSYAVTQG